MPPTMRTLPSGNNVAVWPERGSSMGDVDLKEPEREVSLAIMFSGDRLESTKKPLTARERIKTDSRSIRALRRNADFRQKRYVIRRIDCKSVATRFRW